MKRCTRCRRNRPSAEYHYTHKKKRTICKKCRVFEIRNWQIQNKEKVTEYKRKWISERPHYFREYFQKHKKRPNKRPKRFAQYFDRLFSKQKKCCAICRTKEPGKKGWQLDHCHKTLRIRGVLCIRCNLGLGQFKDSKKFLKRAIGYLNNNL